MTTLDTLENIEKYYLHSTYTRDKDFLTFW